MLKRLDLKCTIKLYLAKPIFSNLYVTILLRVVLQRVSCTMLRLHTFVTRLTTYVVLNACTV